MTSREEWKQCRWHEAERERKCGSNGMPRKYIEGSAEATGCGGKYQQNNGKCDFRRSKGPHAMEV